VLRAPAHKQGKQSTMLKNENKGKCLLQGIAKADSLIQTCKRRHKIARIFLLYTALTNLDFSDAFAVNTNVNSPSPVVANFVLNDNDTLTATGDTTFFDDLIINNGTGIFIASGYIMDVRGVIKESGGTGNLTKNISAGTLNLWNVNTYTGLTNVNGGTLALVDVGSVSSSTTFTLNSGTFDISAATTNPTVNNFGGSASTVNLGSRTLTINNTAFKTYAGSFQGVGGRLVLDGNQFFRLTGASTYTGGTVIKSTSGDSGIDLRDVSGLGTGTIEIQNNAALAIYASGTLSNNIITSDGLSMLSITNGNAVTFSGGISGTGILKRGDLGNATITNPNNTFSGNILIGGGTLALSGNGSISSSSRLTFYISSGNPGTFDISAANSDPTIKDLDGVAGGCVILGNRNLIFGTTTGLDFPGVISGNGGIIKQGAGLQTLSGVNTYTGATTINGGSLEINGSIDRGMTVNSGGTLAGTGIIGNGGAYHIVNNGGTVAPGSSLTSAYGTLTVTGNYSGTGTLNIALKAATLPVTTDVADLAVTGTADLNQTSLTLTPAAGTYTPNASYTILNAGSVVGKFTNDGALAYINDVYKPKVTYGATSVKVKLVADRANPAAAATASSFPQAPVYDYIASLPKDPDSDFGHIMAGLVLLPVSAQVEAVEAINPTSNSTVSTASMQTTTTSTITGGRMAAMRGAARGGATAAPAAFNGSAKGATALTQMLGMKSFEAIKGLSTTLGAFQADVKDNMEQQVQSSNGQGGIWLHTFGNHSTQKDEANSNGFRGKSAGAMVGLDKKLTDNLLAGIGLGLSYCQMLCMKTFRQHILASYFGLLF
jgi:outer membrane autotransporter protein